MKIKKTLLRKSIIATLLLVLAFSVTATNILSVQADQGGIGKFVEITIDGGGTVTMIKLSSGETWVTGDYLNEKVGAGLVRLIAQPNEGYEFDYWIVDGEQKNIGPELEFRTKKGVTSVVAVFVKQTLEITAIAIGPGTINGVKDLTVYVEYGAPSPTFEFAPDNETLYHISLIRIDNNTIGYTTEYTFPDPITSNHEIEVTFEEFGIATAPDDTNVNLLLDSIAAMIIDDTDGGIVYGIALPCNACIYLYDITTGVTDDDGVILLTFQLNGQTVTNVTQGSSPYAVLSDVNNDLVVDGTDVSIVANWVKSTTPGGEYIAEADVNMDGLVNEDDVHTVNENKGETLTALNFWIEGDTLYVEVPDFGSGFRIH